MIFYLCQRERASTAAEFEFTEIDFVLTNWIIYDAFREHYKISQPAGIYNIIGDYTRPTAALL